jgi:hypothetical protein
MTKKWIAITLLLFVVTGLLGWQLYVSVMRFNAENDLSKIQSVPDIKQKTAQDKSQPRLAPSVSHAIAEFAVIPENNVFSESRTGEEKTDGEASLEPPPLTQKPILVGVSIVDDQKRASIIDPASPSQGRNRRSQIRRIGDVYRGYTITDISATHIVLENGTRKEIIPLHEGSKKQQPGKTPILSTRVVSFSGGAYTGGAQAIAAGSGSPASGRTGTTAAGTSASATNVLPVGGTGGAASQRTTSTNATPPQQIQTQVPTTETDTQGRRIIRTPFGNIVRPNRE